MGFLLVNLVTAILMGRLTSTVMLMESVLVELATLDKNAIVAIINILDSLLVDLAIVIQMDRLASTVMLMDSALVKLATLDKNAIQMYVLEIGFEEQTGNLIRDAKHPLHGMKLRISVGAWEDLWLHQRIIERMILSHPL